MKKLVLGAGLLLAACSTFHVGDKGSLQDGKWFLCTYHAGVAPEMECSAMAQDFYPEQIGAVVDGGTVIVPAKHP